MPKYYEEGSKYTKEGERIEGQKIFCVFESTPSFGTNEKTGEKTAAITGNPAVANIMKTWKLKV